MKAFLLLFFANLPLPFFTPAGADQKAIAAVQSFGYTEVEIRTTHTLFRSAGTGYCTGDAYDYEVGAIKGSYPVRLKVCVFPMGNMFIGEI